MQGLSVAIDPPPPIADSRSIGPIADPMEFT